MNNPLLGDSSISMATFFNSSKNGSSNFKMTVDYCLRILMNYDCTKNQNSVNNPLLGDSCMAMVMFFISSKNGGSIFVMKVDYWL